MKDDLLFSELRVANFLFIARTREREREKLVAELVIL